MNDDLSNRQAHAGGRNSPDPEGDLGAASTVQPPRPDPPPARVTPEHEGRRNQSPFMTDRSVPSSRPFDEVTMPAPSLGNTTLSTRWSIDDDVDNLSEAARQIAVSIAKAERRDAARSAGRLLEPPTSRDERGAAPVPPYLAAATSPARPRTPRRPVTTVETPSPSPAPAAVPSPSPAPAATTDGPFIAVTRKKKSKKTTDAVTDPNNRYSPLAAAADDEQRPKKPPPLIPLEDRVRSVLEGTRN